MSSVNNDTETLPALPDDWNPQAVQAWAETLNPDEIEGSLIDAAGLIRERVGLVVAVLARSDEGGYSEREERVAVAYDVSPRTIRRWRTQAEERHGLDPTLGQVRWRQNVAERAAPEIEPQEPREDTDVLSSRTVTEPEKSRTAKRPSGPVGQVLGLLGGMDAGQLTAVIGEARRLRSAIQEPQQTDGGSCAHSWERSKNSGLLLCKKCGDVKR